MNHKHRTHFFILFVLCAGFIVFLGYRIFVSQKTQSLQQGTDQTTAVESASVPISESTFSARYKDVIEIFTPLPKSEIKLQDVTTTIQIKGQARGAWFFEASFPIELVDSSGEIMATGIAQADDEWMTEQFVPFHATVTFYTSFVKTGDTGTLLFKKDNPSGDPEHDDIFLVPVQFVHSL